MAKKRGLIRLTIQLWREYFARPEDPHDPIDEEKRADALEGVNNDDLKEAARQLQERYDNRDKSVQSVQTVSAFTFGGVAALFVAIGAGMLAIAAFYKWMPLLMLPSLLLAGYSVVCFLAGVDSTDDQVHPKHVGDEIIEVVNKVKAKEGAAKYLEERGARSMHQRYRLWVNRFWARRGIRMMQFSIYALIGSLVIFALIVCFG